MLLSSSADPPCPASRTSAPDCGELTQSCPVPRRCPHLPLPMRARCHRGEVAAPLLQAGPAWARIAAREARLSSPGGSLAQPSLDPIVS